MLRLKGKTSSEFELNIPPEVLKLTKRIPATIVIPLYNEELVLPYLGNTLSSVFERLVTEYELQFILVDDGSKDRTWEEMRRLFGNQIGFELVKHDKNRGVAAAILTGIRHARTEIVCSIDCDCTYDPHELGRMIPLLKPEVDLVTASPYHPEGGVRNVPGWRLQLSKMASRMYRQVLRHKLHTYTSCFRVYRRSKFCDMKTKYDGYLGVAEMLGLLDVSGGKIVEFPAVLEVRMLGRSKMKTLRTIFGHLKLMSRLALKRLFPGSTPPAEPPQQQVARRLRELNIEAVAEKLKVGSNY
jgi:glycosyltransferase involved in cell wall biosynthesis